MNPGTHDSFIETRIEVTREYADAISNYIVDNIASGLVLEDEEESPTIGIMFYVPDALGSEYKGQFVRYLREILPEEIEVPEIREKVVKNVEWVEQYKASVRAIRIAGDVTVRPSWQESLPDTRYDIVIEPKMAFGTGSHETTRGCLVALRRNFVSGMRFLDLGTGSGILSILAFKMGAVYIKAIDYDIAAVQNCEENFVLNGVHVPHDIHFGSIDKCAGDQSYDFVCANIIKSTILPMLPRLVELTKSHGILVLSGLLTQDENEISSGLESLGQRGFTIDVENKWLTYTVVRA